MYMYVCITCFHTISIHLYKRGVQLSIHLVKQSDTSLSSVSGVMTLRFKIITVAEMIGTLSGPIVVLKPRPECR